MRAARLESALRTVATKKNVAIAQTGRSGIPPIVSKAVIVPSGQGISSKYTSMEFRENFKAPQVGSHAVRRSNSISNGQLYLRQITDLVEYEAEAEDMVARSNSVIRTPSALLEQKYHVLDNMSSVRHHPCKIRSTHFHSDLPAIPENDN